MKKTTKQIWIVVFALILIIYILYLSQSSLNCKEDCQGKACANQECAFSFFGYKCINKIKQNCCGNELCEYGEDPLNCDEDCYTSIEIGRIFLRTSEGKEINPRDKYEEGQIYRFDTVESDSNIAEVTIEFNNSGNSDIKNLKATCQCWDEDYQVHSKDICYRVPYILEESLCELTFFGTDPVFEEGVYFGENITHLAVGKDGGFSLDISPTQLIEVFRENHKEMYHNISCNIFFTSEHGIKEEVKISNYLIKPELDRYYRYMEWIENYPVED